VGNEMCLSLDEVLTEVGSAMNESAESWPGFS